MKNKLFSLIAAGAALAGRCVSRFFGRSPRKGAQGPEPMSAANGNPVFEGKPKTRNQRGVKARMRFEVRRLYQFGWEISPTATPQQRAMIRRARAVRSRRASGNLKRVRRSFAGVCPA